MQKILILLLLLISCKASLTAQTLNVVGTDGGQEMFDLAEIGKLYFVVDVLLIDQNNGETAVFLFEDISQLNFTDATGDVEYSKQDNQAVILYPNPAGNEISVQYAGFQGEVRQMEIYDQTGQLVKSVTLNCNSAESSTQIDLQGLSAGIYVCRVYGGGHISISKFIKK